MTDFNSKGLYGIYVKDELVYIGQTTASFNKRFNQHKSNIKNKYPQNNNMYEELYEYIKEGMG